MLALSAEISESTTRLTFPPAKKCASSFHMFKSNPALVALIIPSTIILGGTLLKRIPIRSLNILIFTPDEIAAMYNLTGMK